MPLKNIVKKTNLQWSDLPYLLLSAFIFLQLFSLFAFAEFSYANQRITVPGTALPWQIIGFLLLVAGLTTIRIRKPQFYLWSWASLALSCYLLCLMIIYHEFSLSLVSSFIMVILLRQNRRTVTRKCDRCCFVTMTLLPLIGAGVALAQAFALQNPLFPDLAVSHYLVVIVFGTISFGLCYSLLEAELLKNNLQRRRKLEFQVAAGIMFLALLVPAYFLTDLLLARFRSFSTPTYDFGLFHQMFAYMKRTGLPLTTLERDGLYSHLQVHFSPIFYLFLPIYALFPTGETLQILQVVTVISGVIPLLLLGRELKLSPLPCGLLAALYLVHPGLVLSSLYDLHENCFLAPLILWLFWSMFSHKNAFTLIFSLLLLMIKEDAALYVISAALFFFFTPLLRQPAQQETKKSFSPRLLSIMMIALSALVFSLVAGYLEKQGEGLMAYRFASLLQYDTQGMLGIIRSLFQNPAATLRLMWGTEKLLYLVCVALSLGFIPFFTRHNSSFLLFLPLMVMNLATDYGYQYDLTFQYHYGSHTFLILALILVFTQVEKSGHTHQKKLIRYALAGALVSSLVITTGGLVDQGFYIEKYRENPAKFQAMRECLDSLPRDRVIAADTFLTSHLADFPEVYDLDFHDSLKDRPAIDLVIFNQNNQSERLDQAKQHYRDAGYRELEEYSVGDLYILEKSE